MKPLDEKGLALESAESWLEGEINADVVTMNLLKPFFLVLKHRLKKLLGENFIDERNRMIKDDPVNYVRFLFQDANIEGMVIDEGFGKKEIEPPVKYKLLFRIEKIINDEMFKKPFDKAIEYFEETLREKIRIGYAGFKTIIAYRTGLKISCNESKAFEEFYSGERDWFGRKAKALRDFLVCKTLEIAKELKVPIQVHTGAGDRDIKLDLSRPSYLTDVVRKYEGKVILVHAGYPYHRETAWMSYIFPSVYLDISQFNPLAPLSTFNVMKEIFEVSPANKVLYGSDAFNIPEIAWLGVKLAKESFEELRSEFLKRDLLSEDDLEVFKERFFYKNAEELYGF
ncbi:amidohydrolase family protein [Sulfurisphaera ohwakuensis]|uniref:Amidohydrolase family protein n=1 Tax=Sulfurisphaera ohwakuensis TaxID=69656 RepID=A0A650CKT6_SULOH|nr:amidohydrolase family protein [Sulfurisphaera ohwakuensis]